MGSMWNSGSWKAAHNTDDHRERWSLRHEDDPPPKPPKRPKQDEQGAAGNQVIDEVTPTQRQK